MKDGDDTKCGCIGFCRECDPDGMRREANSVSMPYRVEVLGTREGAGWITVMAVPSVRRRSAALWLRAQGYRWTTTRQWRVVPNAHSLTPSEEKPNER